MERFDYYEPDETKEEPEPAKDMPDEQPNEPVERKEGYESRGDAAATPRTFSGEFNRDPEIAPNLEARIGGDANDVSQLNDAMDALENTDVGEEIGKSIRENNVGVKFGETYEGAVAQFDPNRNEITLDESLRDADPSVLAAHLAHEGTHAQWFAQGIDHDSIDQEYHAEKNETAVWDEIKGENIDDQCDFISNEIAQGEADAKLHIRQRYKGLYEH
jgi:hypothetical protein